MAIPIRANSICSGGDAITPGLWNRTASTPSDSPVAPPTKSGSLPVDANGVYLVLTAADVTANGLCTDYCGWHTHASIAGTRMWRSRSRSSACFQCARGPMAIISSSGTMTGTKTVLK